MVFCQGKGMPCGFFMVYPCPTNSPMVLAAFQVDWNAKRLDAKCSTLERDLVRSKQRGVELESELVGARLDAKYLDKELAGRIQQIQILLATNTTQVIIKRTANNASKI